MSTIKISVVLLISSVCLVICSVQKTPGEMKLHDSSFYPQAFVGHWVGEPRVDIQTCDSIIRYNLLTFSDVPEWLPTKDLFFSHSSRYAPVSVTVIEEKKSILFSVAGEVKGLFCADRNSLKPLLEKHRDISSLSINLTLDKESMELILRCYPNLEFFCYDDFENLELAQSTAKLDKLRGLFRYSLYGRKYHRRIIGRLEQDILQLEHPSLEFLYILSYKDEISSAKVEIRSPRAKYVFIRFRNILLLEKLRDYDLLALGLMVKEGLDDIELLCRYTTLKHLSLWLIPSSTIANTTIDFKCLSTLITLSIAHGSDDSSSRAAVRILNSAYAKDLRTLYSEGLVIKPDVSLFNGKYLFMVNTDVQISEETINKIEEIKMLIVANSTFSSYKRNSLFMKTRELSIPVDQFSISFESSHLRCLQLTCRESVSGDGRILIKIDANKLKSLENLIVFDESHADMLIEAGSLPVFLFSARLDDREIEIMGTAEVKKLKIDNLNFEKVSMLASFVFQGFFMRYPDRVFEAFKPIMETDDNE